MKTRRLCFLFFAFIFPGCATALTERGAKVRIIEVETPKCRLIGQIFALDTWTGNPNSVKAKLRNEAAERGGNSFVLEDRPPWDGGTKNPTHALVYECPEAG